MYQQNIKKPVKKSTFLITIFLMSIVIASCGHKQFTEGEYDDVNEVRLLDDKFNEADITALSELMISSLASSPVIINSKTAPVVQVETVRNKTSEHIDTKSITDSVRTALIKTGKVRFSNKEDRDLVQEELNYQKDSGNVHGTSQKPKGNAIGSDFILSGDLISNVQEVGNRKLIFYRLTLNLTNLKTGIIEWSEEKPIRKRFKKKSVGL